MPFTYPRKLWLLLYAFALPMALLAQDSLRAERPSFSPIFFQNLERSFICPKGEFGAPHQYLLNADLVPHFYITGSKNSRFGMIFSATFKVRIRTNETKEDKSYPVRTPSYIPGLRILVGLTQKSDKYRYLELGGYHHSNGQDGSAVDRRDSTVNTYNGTFSTNFFKLDYQVGKHRQGVFGRKYHSQYAAGVEWHPSFLPHEVKLEGMRGTVKANLLASHSFSAKMLGGGKDQDRVETFTVKGQLSYILNNLEGHSITDVKRRVNAEVSLELTPRWSPNTALYVAGGYYGEDPYNIYFQDQYLYLRVGVSTGFLAYDLDRRKKARKDNRLSAVRF